MQLFSPALVQKHDEDSESTVLWGFETKDVINECRRASKLVAGDDLCNIVPKYCFAALKVDNVALFLLINFTRAVSQLQASHTVIDPTARLSLLYAWPAITFQVPIHWWIQVRA